MRVVSFFTRNLNWLFVKAYWLLVIVGIVTVFLAGTFGLTTCGSEMHSWMVCFLPGAILLWLINLPGLYLFDILNIDFGEAVEVTFIVLSLFSSAFYLVCGVGANYLFRLWKKFTVR